MDDLLGGPARGWLLGDIEVEDAPAIVSEHDEDEEYAQASSWYREDVESDEISDMVVEERPPGLGRWKASLREQARDGAPADVEAKLQELAMDSWGAPGVRCGHTAGERADLGVDGRATGPLPSGEPEPVSAETRRCHLRTVGGVRMTRDSLHPVQTLASPTQKRRSAPA
jgi:hypothetical protein